MNNMHSKLSALAVFSELYDNKKDIYYILWEFSKNVIKKREMWQFSPTELKEALSEEFGFDNIPVAVYKTLLRKQKDKEIKMIDEHNGKITYMVMPNLKEKLEKFDCSEELNEQSVRFSELVDELCGFVHSREGYIDLSEAKIIEILKKYLMGEYLSDDIISVVSEFVFSTIESKPQYRTILNQIKEGFVIYEGICWSENLNELGSWRYNLVLYYNMDILFYMAGYSGSIYKTVYDELHELIQEINKKAAVSKKGRYIRTMYFPEVRKQIDNYFECAEQIVRGVRELDGRETAMNYIVSKCDTPSDVQKMRSQLENMLNQNGILEDTKSSFYNVEQHINNIENEELIDKYIKIEKHDREKVERCVRRINYVNMLRNGSVSDKLENCKYLLITRNRLYSQVDYDKDSRLQKQYPRVLTPENLTSKIWFKLNKGFGNKQFPQSLDVLAQAKILIAHQVGKNLADCYDRLLEERKKGTITEEQTVREIAILRQISTLPEEVSVESISESCELKESSIADMIDRQNKEIEERRKQEEQIRIMEEENRKLLQEKENSFRLAEQEIAISLEQKKQIDLLKKEEQMYLSKIESLKRTIARQNEEKAKLKEKKERFARNVLWITFATLIAITVILFFVLDEKVWGSVSSALGIIIGIYNVFKKMNS